MDWLRRENGAGKTALGKRRGRAEAARPKSREETL